MCMEDVRLQRETTSGQIVVSVGTSSVLFFAPSPLRTALVISSPISGYFTLSFNGPVVSGQGMIIPALSMPLRLDLMCLGALVKKGLYIIHSATTVYATAWETSLEKL